MHEILQETETLTVLMSLCGLPSVTPVRGAAKLPRASNRARWPAGPGRARATAPARGPLKASHRAGPRLAACQCHTEPGRRGLSLGGWPLSLAVTQCTPDRQNVRVTASHGTLSDWH